MGQELAGKRRAGWGLGPSISVLLSMSKCKEICVCKVVLANLREDKKSFNLNVLLLPQGRILGQLGIL